MSASDNDLEVYRSQTEPSEESLVYLHQAIVANAVQERRRRRVGSLPWRPMAMGLMVAAAFVAGVLVGGQRSGVEIGEAVALSSESVDASYSPSKYVDLAYQGVGQVLVTGAQQEVQWESGRLDVDVTPEQGVQLSGRTDEALIRVTGTQFSVERSVYGTEVVVEHGSVEMQCVDGKSVSVQTGQSHTCLPVKAYRLLSRARALLDDGAPAQVVLDTVNRGLTLGLGDGPIAIELVVLKILVFRDLGQHADAIALADSYLGLVSQQRRLDLLRLASQSAQSMGGCATALPYLRQLVATEGAQAEDRGAHERCEAP